MSHLSTSLFFVTWLLLYCWVRIQSVDAGRLQKLLGGSEAESKEFFYHASLRSDDYHLCGGTIISEKHILTAAHCVAGLFVPPYDDLTVVTGTARLQGGNQHQVFNVSWHKGYMKEGYANDIAVITLKNKIQRDENQRPAFLPNLPAPYNKQGTISGFGRAKATDSYPSKILLKATAVVISRDECQKYVNHTILNGQICGLSAKGVGIYKGDSGGPFVVNNIVVGIASWHIPWDSAAPDGYTDVYEYLDFIHMIMNQNN